MSPQNLARCNEQPSLKRGVRKTHAREKLDQRTALSPLNVLGIVCPLRMKSCSRRHHRFCCSATSVCSGKPLPHAPIKRTRMLGERAHTRSLMGVRAPLVLMLRQ
jgi:hypothetical protein